MHDIEDTALLIPFDSIYYDKKARHVGAYLRYRRAVRCTRLALVNKDEENRLVNKWLKKRIQSVRELISRLDNAQ